MRTELFLLKALLGLVFGLVANEGMVFCIGSASKPSHFIITSFELGDRACYLNIRRNAEEIKEKPQTVMAHFELCNTKYLKMPVKATWQRVRVLHPDCQGNFDCAKSSQEWLVVEVSPIKKNALKNKAKP